MARQFKSYRDLFCGNSNCHCGLPKLSEAIPDLVGIADFALAGEEEDYQDVPALIQDDEFEAASGSGRAEEKIQHLEESKSQSDPDIEFYDVDRAKIALHGADGNKCGCDLCRAVKQRPARILPVRKRSE